MIISAIGSCPVSKTGFTSRGKNYENPINPKTEERLALLSSIGCSALVGGTAAGIASCFISSRSAYRWYKLATIGILGTLATLGFTLPAKLYDTKVKSFEREKEMDVFAKDKELRSKIIESVHNEIADKYVSLDDKLSHYASVRKGNHNN